MTMYLTQHATTRSQQRAIPQFVIDLLLQFGASEPSGEGTNKLFFDKAARRRIKAYVGPLAKAVDEHLDVYAVVAPDSKVVTVAHRLDRIQRH